MEKPNGDTMSLERKTTVKCPDLIVEYVSIRPERGSALF